jgi:hypothetical protein
MASLSSLSSMKHNVEQWQMPNSFEENNKEEVKQETNKSRVSPCIKIKHSKNDQDTHSKVRSYHDQ